MATEKSRGRKMSWQDLIVPNEQDARSRRQHKRMVRRYESTLAAYRSLAAEFHKDLLKSQDVAKRKK